MAPEYNTFGWNRDGYVESQVEKRFGKIVWYCAIYPKIKGSSLYISIAMYLFLYTSMIWLMAVLIITAYMYLPDIIYISDCLSYFSLLFMAVVISAIFVARRYEFEVTFIESENGFEYSDEIPHVDENREVDDGFKKGLQIGFLTICLAFTAILVITPYVEHTWGHELQLPQGIDLNLLVAAWSPAPNNVAFRVFTMLLQVLDGLGLGSVAFGSTAIMMHFSSFLIKQLRVLNKSISNLNERALNHYNQTKSSFPNNYWFYDSSIDFCLKENVKHFVAIKKFKAHFEVWIDWSLFLVSLFWSFSIGFDLVALASKGWRIHPGKTLAASLLLIAEAYLISFINIPGQMIIDESGLLIESLYNLNWYDYDVKTRNTIIIMQSMFLCPIQLTVGKGLAKVNFQSLLGVFNSAYSFLNLLMAFQTR